MKRSRTEALGLTRKEHKELTSLMREVAFKMWLNYRVTLKQLTMTSTPGYWQDAVAKMHPGHPLHGCLGCGGPFKATYRFFDSWRLGGRFASTTRTWKRIRDLLGRTRDIVSHGQ